MLLVLSQLEWNLQQAGHTTVQINLNYQQQSTCCDQSTNCANNTQYNVQFFSDWSKLPTLSAVVNSHVQFIIQAASIVSSSQLLRLLDH